VSSHKSFFFHDRALFGMDIGFDSLKVMQLDIDSGKDNRPKVMGYGASSFDSKFIKDGVIIEHEPLADCIKELFAKHLVGTISTRRVAISLPANKTFSRVITLPPLKAKDLPEAVRLEAEQYIPISVDDLYLDYSVIRQNKEQTELLAVAVPKQIVDSQLLLARLLGLEVVAQETTIGAAARLFEQSENTPIPTILIDFGSIATDITIYDKTIIVTGTIPGGGDQFAKLIASSLHVTMQEAFIIKTKYGLNVSKKQKEIQAALGPSIESMLKEIRRMIRYYEERSGAKQKIGQIITMGGGANMPGLSDHMTNSLRLPVRMCDPWQRFNFGRLQPPNVIEKSMYVTVAGLSLINPKDIF
jgi:type IV pilus assembly protein PilM